MRWLPQGERPPNQGLPSWRPAFQKKEIIVLAPTLDGQARLGQCVGFWGLHLGNFWDTAPLVEQPGCFPPSHEECEILTSAISWMSQRLNKWVPYYKTKIVPGLFTWIRWDLRRKEPVFRSYVWILNTFEFWLTTLSLGESFITQSQFSLLIIVPNRAF